VYADTETSGLLPWPDDEIWEFAAIRVDDSGTREFEMFVKHNIEKAAKLPDSFCADHDARYDDRFAVTVEELALDVLPLVFEPAVVDGRLVKPHLYGMVPSFDASRLEAISRHFGVEPLHHYHLKDVENIAIGWLHGRAAAGDKDAQAKLALDLENSDELSRAVGVDPEQFARHTAMGDCRWTRAIHGTVTGGAL
jgi:DNA polymerase III epsilon subunit-like protein